MGKEKRVRKKVTRFLRARSDETRAKILESGLLKRYRVPYDEIYSGGPNYLCGYARVPIRIGGEVRSICSLAETYGGRKVCEVQPPMGPPRCNNYNLFQIQNNARPTGMFVFKDCNSYLKLYFHSGAHTISSQVYFTRGASRGRLRGIIINGKVEDLGLDDWGGISETLSQIPRNSSVFLFLNQSEIKKSPSLALSMSVKDM